MSPILSSEGSVLPWSIRANVPVVAFLAIFSAIGAAYAGPYNQAIVDQGIEVWRTAKDDKGRSCSYCHGNPDGFDLAIFNFTEADLRRRDANHISNADTDKVVAHIAELRKKYDITAPKDPRTTRVFQPGGSVLPGATAMARDAAFASTLQTKMPTLATATISSQTLADQAVNEVLNYNMWLEPIGIELPLWSRDRHFGDSHGKLTDWIADVASIPNSPAAEASLRTLEDAYLANPNETTFWAMYHGVLTHTSLSTDVTDGTLQGHERSKYLSSMVASHELRMMQMGRPRLIDKGHRHNLWYTVSTTNKPMVEPVFKLGEVHNSWIALPDYVLPSLAVYDPNPGVNTHKHFQAGKDAWWWIGFMFNPSNELTTARQEYFPNSISNALHFNDRKRDQGGNGSTFTMHSKFLRTKMDVSLFRMPHPVTGAAAAYRAGGRGNSVSAFGANPVVDAMTPIYPDTESYRWHDATHKDRYKKFSINDSKMRLYMIKKDVEAEMAAGKPYRNMNGIHEYAGFQDFRHSIRQLNRYDAANTAHNTNLYNTVRTKLRDWKRGATVPVNGTGTGLKAEIFDTLTFTTPLVTRTDATIDFDPGVPADGGGNGAIHAAAGTDVSVRWTGQIQPRFSGVYNFRCVAAGDPETWGTKPAAAGVRIYFNNVLVYDNWNSNPGYTAKSTGVTVTAGTKYPFRVEYKQPGAYQALSVWWESDKELTDVIPQSQLYPL